MDADLAILLVNLEIFKTIKWEGKKLFCFMYVCVVGCYVCM